MTTKLRKFTSDTEQRQQSALKRHARYEHEEQRRKEQRKTFDADLDKAIREAVKKKPDYEPLRRYLLSMALMAESDEPRMDVIAHTMRTISHRLLSWSIPRTKYLKNLIVDVVRARIAQERVGLKLARLNNFHTCVRKFLTRSPWSFLIQVN